jgi:hypothetical protein
MARWEAHPELKARMERILDLAENRVGDVFRAEAEERAICELRSDEGFPHDAAADDVPSGLSKIDMIGRRAATPLLTH